MKQIGEWIDQVLRGGGDKTIHSAIASQVQELCRAYPVAALGKTSDVRGRKSDVGEEQFSSSAMEYCGMFQMRCNLSNLVVLLAVCCAVSCEQTGGCVAPITRTGHGGISCAGVPPGDR